MRDVGRIKRVLNLIEEIWLLQPDLRLGQLLENLCLFPKQANNHFMLWFQDDDVTEGKLEQWLKDNPYTSKSKDYVEINDLFVPEVGKLRQWLKDNPYTSNSDLLDEDSLKVLSDRDSYKVFLTLFATYEPLTYESLGKALPCTECLKEKLDSLIKAGLVKEDGNLYELSDKGLYFTEKTPLHHVRKSFNELFKRLS